MSKVMKAETDRAVWKLAVVWSVPILRSHEVSEYIEIGMKRVAIVLAEELDYERAAQKLNITGVELRTQISALEMLLCLQIFEPKQRKVELTDDGQFLIRLFRKAVAVHDRNISKDGNETGRLDFEVIRFTGQEAMRREDIFFYLG